MNEEDFEWDVAKAESNLAKHGVSFAAAIGVFADAFFLELCDRESDPSEVRYVLLGMVDSMLLKVVYTERRGRIRIISSKKGIEP